MNTPPPDLATWSRIAPLLDHALDLLPNERAAWLAELASIEPGIAVTVREMLAEREMLDAKQFLMQSPFVAERTLVGTRVGAYTIERLIGRGGMGEVWLAKRTDGRFEGKCAIKFLCGYAVQGTLADRFHREGELLARLTHPNIARLLDAGADADGRSYLAIEYIEGESIDRYIESKVLSIDERVRLFLDVVAAVAHAHSHLIIHRDLKPSNVLVTQEGVVKLLDFGIAKLVSDEQNNGALTRFEDVALTPEYAAPEQLLGETPSTATDIYQLGMLLYVLLTGRHPVQATGTRAEKIRAALDGTVPRASEFAGARFRKRLQGDLDAILSTALRKDTAERYATAQALKEDLLRYLNQEPVLARRGATWYRVRKFVGRHRIAVVASGIAVASVCVALAIALVQMRDARSQRDQARFEAARAEASNQFMSLMLEEVGSGDRPPTMPELLDRAEQLLDKQYGDNQGLVSAMLIDLAGRHLDIGRSEKALKLLARSATIARQVKDNALLARSLCFSAYAHLLSSSPDQAATDLATALEALHSVQNASVELRGECLRTEGRVAQFKGDSAQALTLLEAARELYERNGATKGLQYTAVLTNIGGLHLANGRLAEAYSAFQKADDAFARNGRSGTVGKLTAESNLAIPLARMGEVLAAARLMEHVMQSSITLQTSESSRLVYVVNYANLLTRLDRTDEAWAVLQNSKDQLRVEHDPAFVAGANLQVGKVLFQRGDFAAAETLFQEAEQSLQINPIPNAYALRTIALERARNDLARHKIEQARQRIDAVLRDLKYPLHHTGVEVRNALLTASEIYLQAGKPQLAYDYASVAYDNAIRLARLANESSDVGEAAFLLARAQLALGNTDRVRRLITQAVKSLSNGLGAEHHLTRAAASLLAQLGS